MIESNRYLIDCTAMSSADYSRVFEYLSFTYEACDVCIDPSSLFRSHSIQLRSASHGDI